MSTDSRLGSWGAVQTFCHSRSILYGFQYERYGTRKGYSILWAVSQIYARRTGPTSYDTYIHITTVLSQSYVYICIRHKGPANGYICIMHTRCHSHSSNECLSGVGVVTPTSGILSVRSQRRQNKLRCAIFFRCHSQDSMIFPNCRSRQQPRQAI